MFCESFQDDEFGKVEYEMLPENSHDFKMTYRATEVEVRVTEIAPHEYMTKLTNEEYLNGTSGFNHFTAGEGGTMFGTDMATRDKLIARRVQQKQYKNYQRPTDNELWLCIFSSDPWIIPYFYHKELRLKSMAMLLAEEHCNMYGIDPFSSIWFLPLGLRPQLVWPQESK